MMGEISLINQPVLLDRTPGSIKVAPPERGIDTKDILLELGIDEKDIDRMHKEHIVWRRSHQLIELSTTTL